MSIKKLEKSRVELSGTVPAKQFETYRAKALASLADRVEIDGFRKGHVPADVLAKKVGDMGILESMAEFAIMDAYPKMLTEEKIDAIGRPEIHITKIANDNDLEFTVTTAVMPTVKLADAKKIASSENKHETTVEVTDEEIEQSIKELRQMRAHHLMHESGVEHHDHNHTAIADDKLPELNDEFVKTLGKFENVEDFKTKLRENVLAEKKQREVEKKRIAIMDALIEQSQIDIPDMLVDIELDKMMQQFAYDIAMTGMTFEDYLKKIEKTESQLKSEWRENAEKRAKMQLVIDEIAGTEKIAPNEEEVHAEVQKILEMYKDQKDIAEDRVRAYVVQILTNAKVFDWLESIK